MSGHRLPSMRHARRCRALLITATVAAMAVQPLLSTPASAMDLPTPVPAPSPAPPSDPLPTDPSLPGPTLPGPVLPTPAPVPVPLPAPPSPTAVLPTTTDVVPTYRSQLSCDPAAKPGVEAYARMVMQHYGVGRSGGIVRGCGIGASSEHKEGRAFDYMLSVKVPAQKAAGDSLTQWLTGADDHGVVGGNARRLGVMYVIWNRRIWSTYAVGSGWRAYHGASAHTDHVHTSFTWDGAEKRTSWWDGSPVTTEDKGPCRVFLGQPAPIYTGPRLTSCPSKLPSAPASPYKLVWPGQSGSSVRVAQDRLGMNADGVFGSATRSRLLTWQRSSALPVTGVLDKPTWAMLVPAPLPTPTPTPTPTPAPGDDPTLPAAPPVPGPTPLPTPSPVGPVVPVVPVVPPRTSITPFRTTVVHEGSVGTAVVVLQRALHIESTGFFDAVTATAVKAVQTRAKLTATATVDDTTWGAVEYYAYPLLRFRSTVVQKGSTGPVVAALQKALRLKTDGLFGSGTRSAVVKAQQIAGIPATGVVDKATWVAVESAAYPLGAPAVTRSDAALAPAVLARTTALSPYKTRVLRRGTTGTAVVALQKALGVKADGRFGSGTLAAVRSFQAKQKLSTRSGVVDRRTWDAAERVAFPLLRYRTAVVKAGSKGAAVTALQKALRVEADGRYTAATVSVVKAAQRRAGLPANGIVTVTTWVALEKRAYPYGKRRW